MKVVIIGGGEVGFHVAKALSEEDYDITVVDIDPVKCRRASENLDVIVVEGNGASPNTLNEARVGDADYVLCLTRVDEVNLIDEFPEAVCKYTLAFENMCTKAGTKPGVIQFNLGISWVTEEQVENIAGMLEKEIAFPTHP